MMGGRVFWALSFSRRPYVVAAILAASSALSVRAQAPAASPAAGAPVKLPIYDVISIKPDKTDSGNVSVDSEDDKFEASNVSLEMMILNVYDLKKAQLFGLPKWADSARFDIKAKVVDPDKKVLAAMTPEQQRAMQEPILTDRFQLKFHHEMKVLPVYELVVAKGGPKFKTTEAIGDKKVHDMGPGSISIRNREMTAVGIPMESLVSHLAGQTQRVVVDKTGLTGKYDLELKWSPEDGGPAAPDAPPSIFTALQEQLGLKLQPSKAEVQTFVVDSAVIPSED